MTVDRENNKLNYNIAIVLETIKRLKLESEWTLTQLEALRKVALVISGSKYRNKLEKSNKVTTNDGKNYELCTTVKGKNPQSAAKIS